VDHGHAARKGVRLSPAEGLFPLQLRCFGDQPRDERHRFILQYAGRLAGAGIADDGAARRVRRLARDPGHPQRERVRERHVTVQAVHEDRMLRCQGIDPLTAWQRRAGPGLVVPITARDPAPGRLVPQELADAPRELGGRRCIAQVHTAQLEAAAQEMRVVVDQPGHDQPSVQRDLLRVAAAKRDHLARAAHLHDPAAAHRDRLGRGRTGHTGPHRTAGEHKIGRLRLDPAARDHGQRQGRELEPPAAARHGYA
jgi:hypothetical protein